MSFKFTFREITPEDTEILRILKLRNAKPEEHICCEILRGDGITMKTWYSKADVALWGEDYIKANSKMKDVYKRQALMAPFIRRAWRPYPSGRPLSGQTDICSNTAPT